MALIQCNECDHEVSTTAAACPNCGAPVAVRSRSYARSIVAGLTALVIVGGLGILLWPVTQTGLHWSTSLGTRSSGGEPTHSAVDADSASKVYQTSADQLFEDYNANGVATQSRIGQGSVRVSGAIAAIEEDGSGHPVVKLRTGHAGSADMILRDDQTAAAAQLIKGQSVDIQCKGMHGNSGIPVGNQCALVLVTAGAAAVTGDSKIAIVPRVSDIAPRARPSKVRAHSAAAPSPSTHSLSPSPSPDPPAQPAIDTVPEPVPVAAATADSATAMTSHVTQPDAPGLAQHTAVESAEPKALVASEDPPSPPAASPLAAPDSPDDLATVRQADPGAADHIALYCAKLPAAVGGSSFAAQCRRDEREAWTRLVANHEFPGLDDDTRHKCDGPPFPDSFSAKETCARYQLSKTSASAQR